MSPPGARAPARLRVVTMFTGAGAIDYGCVRARASRAARDGARERADAAPSERGFRSTRASTTRDGARTRDAEDGATTTRATRRRATARREGDEGRD